MGRVLVTDAGCRNTVAAVRSLGSAGLEVVTADVTRVAMSRYSRYVREHRVYPSPTENPDDWIEWLRIELQRVPYDMVLPMDDDTVALCARYKGELARYTHVPTPDSATLSLAQDKSLTIRLAREVGVPVPRTVILEDVRQVSTLRKQLTFPVVIKPRQSAGSRGIVYVQRAEEFEIAYQQVHARYPLPIIQEYIPPGGEACGVFALFDEHHRPVATFAHRRLRSYPVRGGPSTLRESIRAPELVAQGVRLLEAMNWYGVAMVEFRQDPRDGGYKLMEINPRFWGSLALSIYAGVDFPYLLCRVAMGEEFEPVTTYRVGVRCRWLLPGDILHFLSNPQRFQMQPSFFYFDSNTADDFLSWRDPGPTLGFFLMAIRYLLDREKWRHVFRR